MLRRIVLFAAAIISSITLVACNSNKQTNKVEFFVNDKLVETLKYNGSIDKLPYSRSDKYDNHIVEGWYNNGVKLTEGMEISKDLKAHARTRHLLFNTVYREDGIAITSLTSEGNAVKELVIPEEISGQKVVALGVESDGHDMAPGVFENSHFTSISIPKTVKHIYYQAFTGNDGLLELTIPANVVGLEPQSLSGMKKVKKITVLSPVEKLNNSLFKSNPELVEVVLPDTVKELDYFVFSGSPKIEKINLDNVEKGSSANIGSTVYYKNLVEATNEQNPFVSLGKILLYVNKTALAGKTEITIPEGTVEISGSAFRGLKDVTKYNLPNTVKVIGAHAFRDNTSLTSINIPESVRIIGAFAFFGNTKLTSITIPNGVEQMYMKTFVGTNIVSINIPGSVKVLEEHIFNGVKTLTSITLNEGTTSIASNALNSTSIASLVIPASVKSIGYLALANTKLTELFIPKTVTNINPSAFVGIKNATLKFEMDKPETFDTDFKDKIDQTVTVLFSQTK